VQGASVNSAAPAVREPYSVKWVDVDQDIGVSFPGSFSTMDYDNHGPGSTDEVNQFLYANAGVGVQIGQLGIAATGELLRYTVASQGSLNLTAGRYRAVAAYGFFENQVALGAGFRAVTMQLSQAGSLFDVLNPTRASLTMSGLGPEIGGIIKPNGSPIRLGVTWRSAVTGSDLGTGNTTTDASGVVRSGGVIVPSAITLPWELEAGFALQLGPRPLNPPWLNPHDAMTPVRDRIMAERTERAKAYARELAPLGPAERAKRAHEIARDEGELEQEEDRAIDREQAQRKAERKARYEDWPRQKLLLVTSVLVTGASADAIALEDFFEQKLEAYGDRATVSPRFGIEAEPIAGWLKGRVGSYLEPSRFDGIATRQHFTTGFDVKLFRWNGFGITPGQVWRISGAADVAPRYTDWSLSLGAWH
jgi:hypothetical protein